MGRDINSNDRPMPEKRHSQGAGETRPPEPPQEASRERQTVQVRGYRYQISTAEMETMGEVGRFRTVAVDDLAQHQYADNRPQMRSDIASLRAQGLVECRTVWTGGRKEKLTVIVLTKRGKELLDRQRPQTSVQQTYAGFVKPNEVAHDASIYRMYQAEANRIERSGGRVRRVILDYELKKRIYTPLAKDRAKKDGLTPAEYARRQAQVANQNELKVIRGKILLPDLRIEYETPDGGSSHVDLELATHHYRGSQMRGKAEAGFKLYAPQNSVGGLTAAFDPEFTAEIFSF